MTVWRWATGAVLVSAVVIWSCSGGGSGNVSVPIDPNDPRLDAGTIPTIDAGTDTDAGTTDAGTTDGGTTDGGTAWVPPPPVPFPSPAPADWAFYGPQNGGPHDVFGVSADQGGNIWVAGGEDGLFLMRAGTTTFVRYTMADGLRPYGYMPDGSDPVGPKFLKVISVAGGPANTAFVGYEGRNRNVKDDCEGNWDTPARDPSIYKSGDADRVTVDASGKLTVVHYDIFSGRGVVGAEPAGREKICHVVRIVWNPATNEVWFGGNHGFVWGDGKYAGDPKCNGQRTCSGLVEHSHPAINGPGGAYLTADYRGIAIDPVTKDVWFGGAIRTTRFHWGGTTGSPADKFVNLGGAGWLTEGLNDVQNPPPCPSLATTPCYIHNRIDVWPDAHPEGTQPPPEFRTDDLVFGIALVPSDSSVYIGSGYLGLRHLDMFGNLISDETARIASVKRDGSGNILGGFVGALATDPIDASIWVGNRFGGGVDRLNAPGGDQHFSINTFGGVLANMGIEDVQIDTSGPTRKVLVGFHQDAKNAGFIAVYSGN